MDRLTKRNVAASDIQPRKNGRRIKYNKIICFINYHQLSSVIDIEFKSYFTIKPYFTSNKLNENI